MFFIKNTLSVLIVLLTLISINQWSEMPIGNTFTSWIICTIILVLFIKGIKPYYDTINNSNLRYVHWYMVWVGICIFRGLFIPENYWDWKNLTGGILTLALPLSIYIFTNENIIQKILSYWIRYALPLFLVVLISADSNVSGFYMAPISLLALFIPILKNKWKLIIVFVTLFVIFSDLSVRSSVIKYGCAISIGMLGFIKFIKIELAIKFFRYTFLLLPIILLLLALSGIFNVFRMDEYLNGEYVVKSKTDPTIDESLTADTRTFLYSEVINSAILNNYVLWGRTPARGNDSDWFGNFMAEDLGTGRYERYENEVGILNIFTWTGLVGVLLYLLVFMRASYLAIYKSNSIFIKLLGLYVAFRWTFAFVEDFNRFDIANLTLWMMIAMCFSVKFRQMSDKVISLWVNSIFDKRYEKVYQWYLYKKQLNLYNKTLHSDGSPL